MIRSSSDPAGCIITLRNGEWREFVAKVKDGAFDGSDLQVHGLPRIGETLIS